MADFYGCLETTSFRVKDRASFLADADVQHIADHAKAEGFFEENGETFSFGWYGQYPSTILTICDAQTDEEREVSICDVIHRHILPGDVCRIGISGNEKLRYIGGDIQWVTFNGVVNFDGVTEWSNRMNETDLLTLVDDFVQQVRAAVSSKRPEKRSVRLDPDTKVWEVLQKGKVLAQLEDEPIARELAAISEMYEALERLLLAYEGGTAARSVQQQREDATFARAALTKARGEA